MKEIRDTEGNFMGFEGSKCEHHRSFLTDSAWCLTCDNFCPVVDPCAGCFAAWRAENERLRKALAEIADAPFSWARSTLWDIARQALEEKG